MALFQYPMMTVIQEICARIGLVTGNGLGGVFKKKYSKKVVLPFAGPLIIANTINIGADIAAMGASVRLLVPQIPVFITTLSFALFIIGSEIIIPYKKYVKILKYTTLSLFAYVITAIIVGGSSDIGIKHNSTYRDQTGICNSVCCYSWYFHIALFVFLAGIRRG